MLLELVLFFTLPVAVAGIDTLAKPVGQAHAVADRVAERLRQSLGSVQLRQEGEPVEIVEVVPLEHHALDAQRRPGVEL
jgi:hypothetical protein